MRQVNIYGPHDVRLDMVSERLFGASDVLVDVAACGICGTDLHYIRQGGVDGGTMPLGHEAVGVVAAVGRDVRDITLGMRVAINPMATDNVIGNGGTEGAFTERLLVRDASLGRSLFAIPDKMKFATAALAEPLSVALHAVNRSNAKPGQTAVVFGVGPIGLGIVLWLKRRGLSDTVAVDMSEKRLALARLFGARHIFLAGERSSALTTQLSEWHGTEYVFGSAVVGSDVYFDAAGAPSVVTDVISMAKRHATFVVVAMHSRPITVNMLEFLGKEMTLTGAVGYPNKFPEVLNLLNEIGDQAEQLISHRFSFNDVLTGFSEASSRHSAKVMIEFI